MSGMTASVLLRSRFTEADSGIVTAMLRKLVDGVTETRKGRHWEFSICGAIASLSVVDTKDRSFDFEDELIRNNLLFDEAPDAMLLSIGTRRDCDRELFTIIAERLSAELNGVDCGVQL